MAIGTDLPCRQHTLPSHPTTTQQPALPDMVGVSGVATQSCVAMCAGHTYTERLWQMPNKTVWPSGLRRWLQAPVRKGVGSNPTAVTPFHLAKG